MQKMRTYALGDAAAVALRTSLTMAAFLHVIGPTPAPAQGSLAELRPDSRVRIRALAVSARPLHGHLAALGSDSLFLTLDSGSRLGTPLALVDAIDVAAGRRRGRGALVGLGAGLAVDLLLAATKDPSEPGHYATTWLLGMAVGVAMAPVRWIAVAVP